MPRIVSEQEFQSRLRGLIDAADVSEVGCVTGPGRSGAVAAVYASHMLCVPFIPFGSRAPDHLGRILIVDTARKSGHTLRKAERRYDSVRPIIIAAYEEPPRVMFWYEAVKPQRFRHEREAA